MRSIYKKSIYKKSLVFPAYTDYILNTIKPITIDTLLEKFTNVVGEDNLIKILSAYTSIRFIHTSSYSHIVEDDNNHIEISYELENLAIDLHNEFNKSKSKYTYIIDSVCFTFTLLIIKDDPFFYIQWLNLSSLSNIEILKVLMNIKKKKERIKK